MDRARTTDLARSRPCRRAEVVQERLDADRPPRDRPSPFACGATIAGSIGFACDDDAPPREEDLYGDNGAAPLFTGLFGEIPDADVEPIRLPRR